MARSLPLDQMRQEVGRNLEQLDLLSPRQQADCVRVAAEMSLPIWEAWEKEQGLSGRGERLIRCYQKWRAGKVTDATLKRQTRAFRAVLPRDVRTLETASQRRASRAGHVLLTVPRIALEQCGDVHDDWLYTGILDAAIAAASEELPFTASLSQLGEKPLALLLWWWVECSPFHSLSVDPAWLSWNEGTVVRLARAVYDKRQAPSGHLDPERLVVLADALEESGCTDPEILAHLRSTDPHVRGCHVLEALLSWSPVGRLE